MEKVRNIRNASSFPARVAWTWSVVFLGLVLYAMFYYIFGMVLLQVVDAVTAAYNFTGRVAQVLTVLNFVIALHPIFAILGWLLWGFIQSTRRDVRFSEG